MACPTDPEDAVVLGQPRCCLGGFFSVHENGACDQAALWPYILSVEVVSGSAETVVRQYANMFETRECLRRVSVIKKTWGTSSRSERRKPTMAYTSIRRFTSPECRFRPPAYANIAASATGMISSVAMHCSETAACRATSECMMFGQRHAI